MTRSSLFDQYLDPPARAQKAWHAYGLVGNPFPARAHPIWDVLHNQKLVVERFYRDLADFCREGNTTTMFFTGGNRVGKTHFCQYHRRVLPQEVRKRDQILPVIMLSAQSCDFTELYRELIDQLDDGIRRQTGAGLFEDQELLEEQDLSVLPPGDFHLAVTRLVQARDDRARQAIRLALRRWLRAERILPGLRRTLGVASVIESLAHQLNALEALMKLYCRVMPDQQTPGRPGIVVFLDEFELIWTHRRDRRDRFLQAIRAFLDACPKGVFLCVAMTTGLGHEVEDLEGAYPALFARLKGARQIPALVEIVGPSEAEEYANAFLEFATEQAGREGIKPGKPLFTSVDIRKMFIEVAGGGGTASQGDFFDQLHTAAERRVSG